MSGPTCPHSVRRLTCETRTMAIAPRALPAGGQLATPYAPRSGELARVGLGDGGGEGFRGSRVGRVERLDRELRECGGRGPCRDATRILGATLGGAVIGSVYASLYASRLTAALAVDLPDAVASTA